MESLKGLPQDYKVFYEAALQRLAWKTISEWTPRGGI